MTAPGRRMKNESPRQSRAPLAAEATTTSVPGTTPLMRAVMPASSIGDGGSRRKLNDVDASMPPPRAELDSDHG